MPIAPLLRFALLLFAASALYDAAQAQAQSCRTPLHAAEQLREPSMAFGTATRFKQGVCTAYTVLLSMPDVLIGVSGRTFSIPVHMRNLNGLRLEAFEFGLEIDKAPMEIIGVSTMGTLSNGWTVDLEHTGYGVQISAHGEAISDSEGTLMEVIARAAIPAHMDQSFEIIQRSLSFHDPLDFGPDAMLIHMSGSVTIAGDCIEPLKFTTSLLSLAPNPFNSSTAATLLVDEANAGQHAVLEVLNMHGRRVGVLFEGVLMAGTHTFRFDGADLPSGMYVVRMRNGMLQQTRSLRLVK